nr:unnamed protein product [Callosobruchus chinensis]
MKTRKRLRNQDNWRRHKIKLLRNSGKAYRDWRGKDREERKIKSSCVGCRLKCPEKITEERRCTIFNCFWDLKDINRQRDYISKYVECNKKSRTRIRRLGDTEEQNAYQNSKKSFTYIYHLPCDTAKVRVCKTYFLNTLSISAQTVRTVFNKMNSSGHVTEDRRGKACKNSMLEESVKESIRDHINMFETVDSHYCRQKTSRKYLPPTLNIAKMYSLYEEFCLENNIEKKATEGMYRHIFSTEFNLSFFVPKKDLCDVCHNYENSSVEEKLAIEDSFRQHIENKKLARELKLAAKEKAKADDSICAAVFDLQQVLTTPKSEVSVSYYKLKLCTYNFTVFNLASKEADCYMWHECIAKRGSSEIGSCLLLFIEQHIAKGVKEFMLFSDNCPGQNRNKFLFSLYNYLTQKYGIKITHTFLERGHTQNEGDSVHSVIERAARNIPIYSPEQWYTVVRTAKRNHPYHVVEMSQENVFDLKLLHQKTSLNWEKNVANDRVCWNQIKSVQTNPDEPNILFYKDSYKNDIHFKRICILTKGRKSIEVNTKEVDLQRLYKEFIPLKKKSTTT